MESKHAVLSEIQIIAKNEGTDNTEQSFSYELYYLKNGEKQGGLIFSTCVISNIKTAVINHFWSNDSESANALLKEAAMYAWETGFELMFGTIDPERLLANGFVEVTNAQSVYCAELTWNAFNRFSFDKILPYTLCKN